MVFIISRRALGSREWLLPTSFPWDMRELGLMEKYIIEGAKSFAGDRYA